NRLMKAATKSFLRNLDFGLRHGLDSTGMHFFLSLLDEVECESRCVRLEISPSPIALDGVAPVWYFPLQLDFGQQRRFRESYLHPRTRGLDLTHIHSPCQRRDPEPGERSTACVQGQVFFGSLVEPPRRHDPGVFLFKVALLGLGQCRLVPW